VQNIKGVIEGEFFKKLSEVKKQLWEEEF